MSTPSTVLRDAALAYAAQGTPVFPLRAGGKTPLISKKAGGHGYLDATYEIDQIEAWWRRYPRANIGIPTGDVYTAPDGSNEFCPPPAGW